MLDGDAGRNTVRVSVAKAGQLRVLPLKLDVIGQGMPKLVATTAPVATTAAATPDHSLQEFLGLSVPA